MNFFNYDSFYAAMAAKPDFVFFVEVGVYLGESLSFLHKELLKRGTPFQLYGIDRWEKVSETDYGRVVGKEIREFAENRFANAPSVFLFQDDSAQAAKRFRDGTLDFVFIDANHDFDHVIGDIEAWLPKMRKGGIIAGHDYGEPCGVKEAVIKMFGEGNFSVEKTVWWKTIV